MCGRDTKIPAEDEARILADARSLVTPGQRGSLRRVAAQLGVAYHWLRHRIDPEYARKHSERDRRRLRELREAVPGGYITYQDLGARLSKEELARRRALIPEDTRDFTARFCGDPIPGDPRRMQA